MNKIREKSMLAKVICFVGITALYNALQSFVPGMNVTPRIYSKQPKQVTPLMARMMGTWTLTSGLIRIYASFYLHERVAYELCLWTFILAFASFSSEVFYYKTAPLSSPGVWPAMIISSKFA